MSDYTLDIEPGHVNVSPTGFLLAAQDYFKCYLNFKIPERFSPVPFFLCCRAIELALKAKHLEGKTQKEVKSLYSHNLIKSYNDLASSDQNLTSDEFDLLKKANDIYSRKEFEYFNLIDAVTGYSRFPDLNSLADLTKKLVG